MYIVHGPLENMVYFFYRNYHIFTVVRLSYDVKNLGDLRGCYLEGMQLSRRDSVFSNNNNDNNNNKLYLHDHNKVLQYCKNNNTEYRIMHGTERES